MHLVALAISSADSLDQFFVELLPMLSIAPIAIWLYLMLKYRDPSLRSPTIAGTAQVLSVKVAPWVIGNPGNGDRPCTVGLRVSVPERESYEVKVRQKVDNFVLRLRLAPGATVPVEVDARNPQRVRIDFKRWSSAATGTLGAPRIVVNGAPIVVTSEPAYPNDQASTPPADLDTMTHAYASNPTAVPVISAADLIAHGQRVSAVLKSFAPTGTTPRSLHRTPSRPELLDAPHYVFEVELHVPNLPAITARSVQAVPVAQVPQLFLGKQLPCVVDPCDPSRRWAIDWAQLPTPPDSRY
ncbi:hypothetical protein A5658_20695 [Mycobacterium sp. 1245111.1]|uniref:hypothetical protein n=1 Tax=Mycobacterium sp. 1245111.1 TaxID=1834073 RepID=UPI0008022D05|nr:hypothetical protein [Mycobacterium sp. 1245111.1]OBK40779.1 hypothetical protein A5658_20695 [Mycobacterium sp. 1245111.1]